MHFQQCVNTLRLTFLEITVHRWRINGFHKHSEVKYANSRNEVRRCQQRWIWKEWWQRRFQNCLRQSLPTNHIPNWSLSILSNPCQLKTSLQKLILVNTCQFFPILANCKPHSKLIYNVLLLCKKYFWKSLSTINCLLQEPHIISA